MVGIKTVVKVPLTDSLYLSRAPGVVMKIEDEQLLFWSQENTTKTSMNQSAAVIWFCLDGQKTLNQIIHILKSKYLENLDEQDISVMIDDLLSKNMLTLSKQPEIRPLFRVAFYNFWPGFNDDDNYFLWMLSHRADVIIVDSEKGDPNLIFYSTFSSENSHHELDRESVLKICYSATANVTDLDQCDVLLADNLDGIKASYNKNIDKVQELPNWSIFVDWNFYDKTEMWRKNDFIAETYLPENICNRIMDNLFGELLNTTTSEHEQHDTDQKKLTIGLIASGNFEEVYLSVQSIRMHHPECVDKIEILIVDSNPNNQYRKALQELEQSSEIITYYPYEKIQEPVATNVVFREAETPFVMIVDPGVLLAPSAIEKLLNYLEAHPNTQDLLHGPVLNDDLNTVSTHLSSEWEQGLFGKNSQDERGNDKDNEPFAIQMHSLKLFACAKDAWPGLSCHLKAGMNGEGYIHEKIKQKGGQILCIPFLRWIQPSAPDGEQYISTIYDRLHDYLIGFLEVNLDIELLKKHFISLIGEEDFDRVRQEVESKRTNPFFYFDAIYCITNNTATDQIQLICKKFEGLGIVNRVRFISPLEPFNSKRRFGFVATHRYLLSQAQKMKFQNILIIHDTELLHTLVLESIKDSITELKKNDWNIFYIDEPKTLRQHSSCKNHKYLKNVTTEIIKPQVLAYNKTVYDKILSELPEDYTALKNWLLSKELSFDTYLATIDKRFKASSYSSSKVSPPPLSPFFQKGCAVDQKSESHGMQVFGEVNPDVDFYVVYSTSNIPYQNWQSELLEYSFKNGEDGKKCQIIKLLSNDSSQRRDDFELGSDVTFVFKEYTDRLPQNEFYAPLNKPYSLIRLTEWWYKQKQLDNDSIFIVLDPDMVWFKPISKKLYPPKNTIFSQQWYDNKVMYPFISRVRDIHKIRSLYRYYTYNSFIEKGYFREMYAFEKAVVDSNLEKIVDNSFGPFVVTGNQQLNPDSTHILHYCNKFKQDDNTIWFKQDYTPSTLTRPWKRPVDWSSVTDVYQRYILKMIHEIIDEQEKISYTPPKKIALKKDKLDVYLWGISDDKEYIVKNCEYAMKTAKKFHFTPKLLGLHYDWAYLSHLAHGKVLSRLYILRDLVNNIHDNRVLLVMDGFDTLFNGTKKEILDVFYSAQTNLLFSSEQAFTYQWPEYKDKYDQLKSKYRYLNAGTFIGYADSIKRMVNDCINHVETAKGRDRGNEQGILGKYFYNNFENETENKLDYNCELFWVTPKAEEAFRENPFYNRDTQSNPIVYHVIGGRNHNFSIYKEAFEKIIQAR